MSNLLPNEDQNEDKVSIYDHSRYSLVSTDAERKNIKSRVEKNPKSFTPYDFEALYKIVLIGESNTGKTSMLVRFAENQYNDGYLCTIGVDFKIKTLVVDNKLIKMQIWDTAGQERFRSISQAYYRNSHGCIAVYDISSRASFDLVEEQIRNFIAYSSQEVASNIILVGNKTDLDPSNNRKVQQKEAVQLAKRLNLAAVFETSAKINESIDDVFYRAVINCVDTFSINNAINDSSIIYSSRSSRSLKQKGSVLESGSIIQKRLKSSFQDEEFEDNFPPQQSYYLNTASSQSQIPQIKSKPHVHLSSYNLPNRVQKKVNVKKNKFGDCCA